MKLSHSVFLCRQFVLWDCTSREAFGLESNLTLTTKIYGVLLGDIKEAFFMARCEEVLKAVCLTSCCIRTAGVLFNDTCQFVGDGEVEAVSAFYLGFFFSWTLYGEY